MDNFVIIGSATRISIQENMSSNGRSIFEELIKHVKKYID